MKIARIIFHPFFLLLSFSLILISGEHLGGFYAMYIFMALPYGATHAVAAVIGAVLIAGALLLYYRRISMLTVVTLNIAGLLLLLFSLVCFFYQDKTGYNLGTFQQPIPLFTVGLFAFVATGFLARNVVQLGWKQGYE